MGSSTETIRILHVDDEPELAEMATIYLTREDDRFEIETAVNAAEGLDRIAEADFDCVVSDYDMPGQNGIEFLEAVREEFPGLPFILYTGKGSEEVASDAITSGVTDYLQKETGTSQYTVLANRIANAVEQSRSAQRADELGRIRSLSKKINRAIVRADSREAVETRVCEIISESTPYLFAWIGEVDPETGRVDPDASAGKERGYLDDITITTDRSPTGEGPAGTAVRERRVVVSQDISKDPGFEPWREEAIKRGFQSVAAIPLEYQRTLYGVLAVYAEHQNAYDETERELLAELGDDIAHVINSFEVRDRLREERDFIEQAIDSLNDIFYVISADGSFRRWNDNLVEVTGYTDEDIGELQVTDLFPETERGRVNEAIEEVYTTGEATVESKLLTADGNSIPYEFTGSRLTGHEDMLTGLIGIGRDISNRKQREEQLRRLVDNLPGMVYRCENQPGWPIDEVRGEVIGLTGYHPSELENQSDIYGSQVIHPDDRERVWSTIQDAIDSDDPFELTYRIQTKDGDPKWVWERGQVTYSNDDEEVTLEGFITDVTNRERQKRTINVLHETAQSVMRAETAEKAAEIAVEAVHDVLDMPASAIHFYDEQTDELVPVTWTAMTEDIVGEPPTIKVSDGLAGNVFETGVAQIHEDVSTRPGRLNPDTSVRSEILLPLDGHGVLLIGSTKPEAFDEMDISLAEIVATHTTTALDRIERERELEEQNDQLAKFASIVSHDLRNPLSVAEGYLELHRSECDSEHLEAVAGAHDRIGDLIADLLELAREGANDADSERVDLSSLTRECWKNVDTAEATLVNDMGSSVHGDHSRLAQLLENLIRNAVEHGGEDVTITIGDLETGFYVEDDGPGIPADDRERIFASGYSTRDDGTGFGLAIVEGIVKAHGCDICITQSESGGARFEITGFDNFK